MSIFSKSKWIWANCKEGADQYTEYKENVKKQSGKVILNLSCDSDYTLFINGKYIASNQYGDFEHYKIYDELDVTQYLDKEENNVKFLVYHCGVNTQRYRYAKAGLIYEIISNGEIVAYSSERTKSRLSRTYESGRKRFVSSQLGFTFTYDSTKENELGYKDSISVDKEVTFFKRPVPKLTVCNRAKIKEIIKKSPTHYLIDLGTETVGFATLDFASEAEQKIEVAYGESLDNGSVRKIIGGRCFAFEYRAKQGRNEFTDYMLRLACRYLEVFTESPIEISYIGILPQKHEVNENSYVLQSPLDNDIYRICVNTLRLCMMEHYVDTPWREQCLYAFDSRNQMLCGYYAFENGNRDYARANLKLLGMDKRADNLLSICAPCGTELAIPSFSLYYLISMKEYVEYTWDLSLSSELLDKMKAILLEFWSNTQNGLICKFTTHNKWNFYDWSEYLDGWGKNEDEAIPDLIINCLFLMALDAYNFIAKALGKSELDISTKDLKNAVKQEFLCGNAFTLHKGKEQLTELGNALAVLSGVAKGELAKQICDKIAAKELTPSSLSMYVWKYDALLLINKEKYKDFILGEIRASYKPMLDLGDTVWETAIGSSDFDNAGSLCHGWSAIPIYIYHKLDMVRKETK